MSEQRSNYNINAAGSEDEGPGYYTAYTQPADTAYNTPDPRAAETDVCEKRPGKALRRVLTAVIAIAVLAAAGGFFASRYSVDFSKEGGALLLAVTPKGEAAVSESREAEDTETSEQLERAIEPLSQQGMNLRISAAAGEGANDREELSYSEIYKKCVPSIVEIYAGSSRGTGVILTQDGYIVTAYHVVDSSKNPEILVNDGRSFTAVQIGRDLTNDIALLKVEASDLQPAELGDSGVVEVGTEIAAIGNSLGQGLTLTNGIVSATDRVIEDMSLIQTNAAVNEGCSGGALINRYGQVVGIINIKMASASIEGVGYALPMNAVKQIAERIALERSTEGEKPYFGLTLAELSKAALIYYRLPEGLYIDWVDSSSDTYAQGIRRGDMLTAIDGMAVSSADDFEAIRGDYYAGETVKLTIYRSGWFYDVYVTLGSA